MINLDEIAHKESQFNVGSLVKRMINIDGQYYIFKANNGFPYTETPSGFGEVLYSRIARLLKAECVVTDFAKLTIEGRQSNGVLVKHFYTPNVRESLTFGQILTILTNQNLRIDEEMYVANILTLIGAYARVQGYKFDEDRVALNLNKMAVMDFFFSQRDRHPDNLEFLITQDEIMLAPMFDNGFCFNLTHFPNWDKSKFIDGLELFRGVPQFLTLRKVSNYSIEEFTEEFIQDIIDLTAQDSRINVFVNDIVNLNINNILADVYNDSGKDFSTNYIDDCCKIFNFRVKLFRQKLKDRNAEKEREDLTR